MDGGGGGGDGGGSLTGADPKSRSLVAPKFEVVEAAPQGLA